VEGLHARQTRFLLRIVAMMRQRMEGFVDADVVVRAHADFFFHHEAGDVRQVDLVREGHQVEQDFQVVFERSRDADWRVRNFDVAEVLRLHHLHATFYFAHGLEVVRDHRVVGCAELALQH
jgi:hypothetical protein